MIKFANKTTAEVDALIFCTGYACDFSLISDLTTIEEGAWSEKSKSEGKQLQRLYQNIFPSSRADSIAFLNNFTYPRGYMWIADLARIAVAQVLN